PEIVAAEIGERSNTKTVIVHSDLSKFYDRVRPAMLHAKLKAHITKEELPFFNFARKVLNWKWDERDDEAACGMTDVADFSSIALPQGLVSSGFFANIVLLDFDDAMRAAFNSKIAKGVVLRDVARYVDDLRFVIEVPNATDLKDVESVCHAWVEQTLQVTAPGLTANGDKTRAVAVHDSQRVMVFQSRRMRRIQETVSGGFDANGGTQLLAALEGLFNTIGQFIETDENGTRWPLKAVPDVRDETVARFVAGRYRSTFRSLRPLLEDEIVRSSESDTLDDDQPLDARAAILTKDELDRQSQAFGLRLIEEWIRNPGNVRLLRVGLDLFPDSSVLESVIGLLKPIMTSSSNERGIRSVAEYCLAELFRAAATETGLVPDRELLPGGIDIEQYQDVLRDYARELMADHWDSLSWFCQQQILLFVAASSPVGIDVQMARTAPETAAYATMLAFLQGQSEADLDRWTANTVLARQSYLDAESAARLIVPQLTSERIARLAELAPAVAEELLVANSRLRRLADKSVLNRLSLPQRQPSANATESVLPLVSESRRWNCRLRDELSLIRFALEWLEQRDGAGQGLSPAMMKVSFAADVTRRVAFDTPLRNSLFEAPDWCPANDKWRYELGFVLRFIITGQSDPTETLRHPSWREHEHCYRPPSWHWKVRRYSLFNGRDRLGPEWLPLSSWMESFLTALLHWPGAVLPQRPFHKKLRTISQAKALCEVRVEELESMQGEATGLLMLPVTPRSTWNHQANATKPLRVCNAQLAVPEFRNGRATKAFGPHDPEFNAPATRHHYRRHLTAMLAGVDQMLRVRATHRQDAGLDFLLLPELAVHPDDVRSRLLPFVRKHRCWVFAGLTYHRCHTDGPLVNSGLWIVPESSPSSGVSYRFYEQGKQHLAPEEEAVLSGVVQGHRPCQWLLRWKWSSNKSNRPLILSGSICYDATDLALAADLKKRSDIYAISALNRDVGTFDRMTDALHYHMYQMVVLANHAHFGGSNAYVPYREQFH
ncbi:MAG: RNA-directed DNA polymerase, partial [Planctomycetota bacterium]|nr:RNA-directed DNA polymerase [Planctomycetota bacterium]